MHTFFAYASSTVSQSGHVRAQCDGAFAHPLLSRACPSSAEELRARERTQFARISFVLEVLSVALLRCVLFESLPYLRIDCAKKAAEAVVATPSVFIVQQTHLSDHCETCRYGFAWHLVRAGAHTNIEHNIWRVAKRRVIAQRFRFVSMAYIYGMYSGWRNAMCSILISIVYCYVRVGALWNIFL